MLELRGLAKHFLVEGGEPIRAVDGVSMKVKAGEFVAVYGPSGSGKTTLLELIAGLQPPDRGNVIVNGRDIVALSEREREAFRRTELGVIGQPQNLIPGARAIDNASLKAWLINHHNPRRAVEAMLEQLGLGGRMSHRTEQLSMGERQRVLIARVLVTDPKLIVADEPTGSLDTLRTAEVLGLLRDHCRQRGAALVLATHDPQASAFADQVHELRDGRLDVHAADPPLQASRASVAEP